MTINQIPGHPYFGQPFPRGAKPSPKALRELKPLFSQAQLAVTPSQVAYVPVKLDDQDAWGNHSYGDCVTAEECFVKACTIPGGPVGVFIPAAEAIRWARAHSVLNGASLIEVLEGMQQKGFVIGTQIYSDGDHSEVQFDDENLAKASLAVGPGKIAIDANALPSGAGNSNGWFSLSARTYRGTDHCIPVLGFGTAKWLFQQFGAPLPAGLPPDTQGYVIGTWGTWGFVTFAWLQGTCDEWWVRMPSTVGVPPLPIPAPPTPTPTPIPPGPTPPQTVIEIEVKNVIQPGKYLLFLNTPV